jgi:hypothetical protein
LVVLGFPDPLFKYEYSVRKRTLIIYAVKKKIKILNKPTFLNEASIVI